MKKNPLAGQAGAITAGRSIFQGHGDVDACTLCHGKKADGRGSLGKLYNPPPRNFACGNTMGVIPDGQLFWIIRHGSSGTGMPEHLGLSDNQIWQLVAYVRQMANTEGKSH